MDENNPDYNIINYIDNPPTKAKLIALLKKLKMKPIDLIRTQEEEFKPYLGKKLSDEKLISLMIAHPILIERPIVVVGNKAVIARPPESLLELL